MRYIAKSRAPIELLRWKKQNPQAGFAEMPSELKCCVRCSLLMEQGFLCAYTMKRITEPTCHIEHFHPQSAYPQEVTEYANLLACWPGSGEMSAAMDPLLGYGAAYKRDETTEICSPNCLADVDGQFLFDLHGGIKGLSPKAQNTIRVLHLDAERLRIERRAAILGAFKIAGRRTNFPSLSAQAARRRIEGLRQPDAEGRLEPFCLVLEQCLKRFVANTEGRAQRMKNQH